MKKGLFVTLEGVEGAGKSTAAKFLDEYLKESGIEYIMTREPGGTEIAEKIRRVLLDHYQEKMHPDTEMLLYFAGRAQHLNKVIIPALEEGKWVICDRFTDATYAYQGAGRGLSKEKIAVLENWVQNELRPDYTLLFDVEVKEGLRRVRQNRELDRFEVEQEAFFERIRDYYLEQSKEQDRFLLIDANKSFEDVKEQIADIINKILKQRGQLSSK